MLPTSLAPGAEERARTLSLIDFLADYDARRNPPVYDIGRYDLFLMRDADLPGVPGVNLSPAAQAWLTVDFLDLPPRPEVPDDLVGLLGETADISPHARPEVRTTERARHRRRAARSPTRSWYLPPRTGSWPSGSPSPPGGLRCRLRRRFTGDLFLQRELLARDRESVELVWGFGRLRWEADGAVLDHPLITIPVEVEQDDATQRIRVCPAGAPEVEARCLAALSLADRAGFMSIRQSVNDDGLDLWDGPALEGVLRPLVRAIDHEGMLVEQAPLLGPTAMVDQSWVLFMRRRQPDYLGFLDRMRPCTGTSR